MGAWLQVVFSVVLVVSLMFASGLELRPADLVALGRRPRVLLLSVLVNVVAFPLFVFGLLTVLSLPPAVVLGLMLCLTPPAGPAAVLYVSRAKAELPLAVGLTIVLPVVGLVTTPMAVSMIPGLPPTLAIPVGPMVGSLVAFQLLPLAIGLLIRGRAPTIAAKVAPVSRRIGGLTLVTMVVALLAMKGGVLQQVSASAWLAVLVACGAALGLGYVAGGPDRSAARSGALVAVSRNLSVAIMLASTFAKDPVVDALVLSGALVVLVVPLVVGTWWGRSAGLDDRPSGAKAKEILE